MTRKKSPIAKKPPPADRAEPEQGTNDRSSIAAQSALLPTVQAALTVWEYSRQFGEVSFTTLVQDLRAQVKLASDGDLSRPEALLLAQAHSLDSIFNALARKAAHAENLNQIDVNLRLALKAQSQSRATLEALAAIKHPRPVAFVQQANIANGPQQVNNGVAQGDSRARESETVQNKVLEKQHGERLDTGTTGPAVGADPAMAAVGEVDGAADGRG